MAKFYSNLSLENYKRAMSGSLKNFGVSSDIISNIDDNTISNADSIKNVINIAESETSENHDDDDTWLDKVRNFFNTINNSITEGVLNFADAIGDFTMGVIGGVAGAFGNEGLEETMTNAINTDWQANVIQAEHATANSIWNAGRALFDPNYEWKDYGKEWTDVADREKARENINNEKYGTDLSNEVMDTISGVSQGVGQMLPSLALGQIVTPALTATGMSAKVASAGLQTTTGFVQGAGRGYSTVAQESGDLVRGSLYAGLQGAIQGIEQGASAYLGGTYAEKNTKGLSDKFGDFVASKMNDGVGKMVVAKGASIIADVAFDTTGEVLEEALDPVLKQITYDATALYSAYGTSENFKSTLEKWGQVALTSALTSTIVDTVRGVGEIKSEIYNKNVNEIRTQFDSEQKLEITDKILQNDENVNENNIDIKKQRIKEVLDIEEVQKDVDIIKEETVKLAEAKRLAEEIGKDENATEEQKKKAFEDAQKITDEVNDITQEAFDRITKKIKEARSEPVREVNVYTTENKNDTKRYKTAEIGSTKPQNIEDIKEYINPKAKRSKVVIKENIGGNETTILKARYKTQNDANSGMILSSTDTLGRGTKKGLQILSNSIRNDADVKVELEVDSKDLNIVREGENKRLKFSNTSKPDDLEALVSKMESDSTYKEYKAIIGNEDVYEYEDGLILRVNNDTGETKVELINKNDIDNGVEKDYTKLTNEEIDYEFRRIQESSKNLLSEFESGDTTYRQLDEGLRRRYSECIRRQLEANVNRNADVYESNLTSIKKRTSFNIYSNVDGDLFHNAFETIKPYVKQNELVDLHENYSNAKCYLSKDGLQGFAIEENGNLVSVFNADINKRGYIDAVKDFVKENGATHLDCYGYLADLYSKEFGFKVASDMDYNMEYDHHNIAKNYDEPNVSFLVNTDQEVETKHFNKDQYDEAKAYQQSFLNDGSNVNNTADNTTTKNKDTFGQRNSDTSGEVLRKASDDTYVQKQVVKGLSDKMIDYLGLTGQGELIHNEISEKRLQASYDLDNDESFKKASKDYLNEILESKFKDNDGNEYKLGDYFESEDAKQKWIDEVTPTIKEYLDERSKLSQHGRETIAYQAKVNKLKSQVNEVKNRRDLAIKSFKLVNQFKNLNEKVKGKVTAGQPDINLQVSNKFRRLAPKVAVTSSGKGFSANTIVNLVNAEIDVDTDIDIPTEIKDAYNRLKSKVTEEVEITTDNNGNQIEKTIKKYQKLNKNGEMTNSNAPTFDDQTDTYDVLNWFYKNEQGKAIEERNKYKRDTASARMEIDNCTKQFTPKKNSNGVTRTITELTNSMRNPESFFGQYLSQSGKAYDIIYRKPTQNHFALANFNDKAQKFREQAQSEFNIKDTDLAKKANWAGLELQRNILLEIYASSQSANLNDLLENGFQYKEKGKKIESQVIKPTPEQLDELSNILTDNEKAYANKILKDGYNSLARQQLINYGQAHGLDIVNPDNKDLYMHINRGNLRMDVGNDLSKVSSLGTGIFKERTSNKQPMYFNGLGEDFLTYMDSVGQATLMDDVKNFNRFVNVKDENNKSVANMFSMNIKDGTNLLTDWQKRINNVAQGSSVGNSRLVANATVAPIVMNIGTWLKMPLDSIRLIPEVGIKNWLTGLVKGIGMSFTPTGRETINRIVSESGFYASMNSEHYAVASDTISTNYNKVSKALMKPIEAISNYMFKYMVTPIIEEHIATQYSGQTGYEVGGINNEVATRNWLDTNAQMFLSNSDSLDKSYLRAGTGKGGAIGQLIFGLYGGDSQKWVTSWRKAVFGNVDANKRIQGFEAMQKECDTKLVDVDQQISDIKQQLEDLEIDTEDVNYEKSKAKLEDQLDNAQLTREGLEQSKIDAQNGIQAETEYKRTTPKRIAYLAGAFLMSACLEVLINKGNAKLKGRDEDGEDYLTDVVENATYGWIPYISTFGNMVKYNNDVSMVQVEWLNQAKDTFSSLGTLFNEANGENGRAFAMNVAKSMGYLAGIPVDSIVAYSNGALKNFGAGTTAYEAYTYMNGYNSTYLSNQMSIARENGNNKDLKSSMEANLLMFKTGKPSSSVTDELARLYMNEQSVMPKDYKKDGYNSGQIENFRDVYVVANSAVEEAISTSSYTGLEDTVKSKIIKKIFDAYYEGAEAITDKTTADSRIGKVIQYTNGNLIIGKIAVIAFSAESKDDIAKSTSLTNKQKALAKYLAGYSLSESEENMVKSLLKEYGANSVSL